VLEKLLERNKEEGNDGPFFCGPRPTLGDAALGASLILALAFFPKIKYDPFAGREKLKAWWEALMKDRDFQRVHKETRDALEEVRQSQKPSASKL